MSGPPDVDDTPSCEDVDSEPRRRWKPNAELLRALADARKDLKPGESSLFWDWTATREAAPEAEDVRPSGEGEVFVHEKDAAATYIPPVQVAPAVPPRQCTKSRIRVREDVDPRRQPTVRTARGTPGTSSPHWLPRESRRAVPCAQREDRQSVPCAQRDSRPSAPCVPDSSRPVATFRDASDPPPSVRKAPGTASPPWESQDVRQSIPRDVPQSLSRGGDRSSSSSWPATTTPSCAPPSTRTGDRPAFIPSDPGADTPRPDRRRRIALAVFVGVLSGTLSFFGLRSAPERTGTLPPSSATSTCPASGDGEATLPRSPAMTCVPVSSTDMQDSGAEAGAHDPSTATARNKSASPTGTNDSASPTGTNDSASPTGTNNSDPGARAATQRQRDVRQSAPRTVPTGAPTSVPTSQGGGGFFVRKKKGSN